MSGTIATPSPFVPWPVLSSFYSPLKNPSRGQYRQALKFVDGPTGVTVRPHRKGRFAGQRRFHSVLTVLAIRAKESGDADGAELLHEAAARLEQAYSTPLAHFLQSSSEEDLPTSDFYDDLVTATREAIDSWGRMARLVFASGEVTRHVGDSVEVVGSTTEGEPVELLLPAAMWPQPIDTTVTVLVFRRLIGSAALVELLPAVTERDHDEEASAARYRAGPGHKPSPEEFAFIRAQVTDKPARHVTLVG